jgi:uncharacterized protein YidB (DUF937 family)
MGLLDQVPGSVMSGASSGGSPLQNVLMSMLGGGQQTAGGGLGGLISGFQQAGLGHLVQSWVGNGANQPVSPDQLQSVFGENAVQGMAGQAGMAPQDFLAQLSQHLPGVVNEMTPNGHLPDEGTASV